MNNAPFTPLQGKGQPISASTTSASITLDAAGVAANQLAIYNAGSVLAFVRVGIGAQTATSADLFIPPGAFITITKGRGDTVAAITASSTATIYVMPGEGV